MTDTKTLTRPTTEQPPEPKTRRLDMSATQLIGGALAAMTAAVIGAQLGVAGTVLGAAIGSVVAGTAGSLYTASLKHTKDKIASAFVGRVGDTEVEVDHRSPRPTHRGRRLDTPSPNPTAAVAPASPDPVATAAEVDSAGDPPSRWRWKPILVSTAAVFLLAIAGITAFELISGQSVSGGQGTTITQVGEGRSGGTDTPTQAPSSSTSTGAEHGPVGDPEHRTSAEPSSEPSQSPSLPEPSQSTEPSASTEPTPSASPSTAGSEDPQVGSTDTGTAGG